MEEREHSGRAVGVVAIGRTEAEAYRLAGLDVQELADAWDWLAMGEAGRIEARAMGSLCPDSEVRGDILAWAAGRKVIVPQPAGMPAEEGRAVVLLAIALRVQSAAEKIVHAHWG